MQSFGVLSVTFDHYRWLLRLASIFKDTYHYCERTVLPTCEHCNVNEHPRNPSGVLLVTSVRYDWLLGLASFLIERLTITSNARYLQLVNTIMLMNTLAIHRGTFGNFGPLSLTTSTCVNLHRDLYHYLERALSPTWEHYIVNEHPRNPSGYFSVTFDHYRWLLRVASIFKDTYHCCERTLSPTWAHYNVNEHPRNPSGYFR